MRTFSAIELGLAVTIIALAGISVVTAASFLGQSANATTNVMTNTIAGEEGEEEPETTTTTTTINNVSNALLARLFSYGEGEDMETNVNPINETYIVVSYSAIRDVIEGKSLSGLSSQICLGFHRTRKLPIVFDIVDSALPHCAACKWIFVLIRSILRHEI